MATATETKNGATTTLAVTQSVIRRMADRYGMTETNFQETMMATVWDPKGTKGEFLAFLSVAEHYNLNPLLKEIYGFAKKGGGIQPIVPVDGWANIINSHAAFDGMEFHDHLTEGGELEAITCKMFRKDRSHPVSCTEYMEECKGGSEPWKRWPRRMLRHKAMIQAARYAFSLAGIMDPDEADRAESAGWSQGHTQGKVGISDINKLLAHMPTERATHAAEGVDDVPPDEETQEPADPLEGFHASLARAVTKDEIRAVGKAYMTPKLTEEQMNEVDAAVSEKLDAAPDMVERKTKQKNLGE